MAKTTNPLPSGAQLLQNPDVICREGEPGGPMLFNPDNNEMRIINETGLWIWKRCRKPVTMDELLSEMKKTYDVTEDRVEIVRDLTQFIKDMITQGYIGLID